MMAKNESEITCAMCGKVIFDNHRIKKEELCKFFYNFDSNDCVLMFKKFRNVYGTSFI